MSGENLSFDGEIVVDRLANRLGMNRRRPIHVRLTEGIAQGLLHGGRGPVNLRDLVFELTQRATKAGVSRDEMRIILVEFVSEHPLCYRLDRVCLYDGRRLSERLAAQVGAWVDVA